MVRDKHLYVGHGTPGGAEPLDEQERYLHAYRKAATDLARGNDTLDDEGKSELVSRMEAVWHREADTIGATPAVQNAIIDALGRHRSAW